jgi:hypothetical protein
MALHWRKSPDSNVDGLFGFQCAWWLAAVQHKKTFEPDDSFAFACWILKKNVLKSLPRSLDELVDYVERNCVGLEAQAADGPSPFMYN